MTIIGEYKKKSFVENENYYNPSLGLATKARGCKVAGQKKDPGITSHAPGSAKSVRE
jgi:hypothetical protein